MHRLPIDVDEEARVSLHLDLEISRLGYRVLCEVRGRIDNRVSVLYCDCRCINRCGESKKGWMNGGAFEVYALFPECIVTNGFTLWERELVLERARRDFLGGMRREIDNYLRITSSVCVVSYGEGRMTFDNVVVATLLIVPGCWHVIGHGEDQF